MIPRKAILTSVGFAIVFGVGGALQWADPSLLRRVAVALQIFGMTGGMFWLGYSMGTRGK